MYKVMIVDDNMTNLIMAKKVLEEIYEIVPVSAGKTALEFLHDMPDPPDIILLDVVARLLFIGKLTGIGEKQITCRIHMTALQFMRAETIQFPLINGDPLGTVFVIVPVHCDHGIALRCQL